LDSSISLWQESLIFLMILLAAFGAEYFLFIESSDIGVDRFSL
jgi:hypothetical protein